MAIIMGVGGYTLYEVQQNLAISNELLDQGQSNIRDLDSRLDATGTDVSKTIQDLSEQVKVNFSEIDKLWKVAHRQNRPDIQKNMRELATLKSEVVKYEARSSKMIASFDSTLSEMNSLTARIKSDNQELITEISMLRGRVEDQSLYQEADKRDLNLVKKELKEIVEAIDSIDQHRRIINQKLAQLREDVQLKETKNR
jgi:chromosome segregation ATPase